MKIRLFNEGDELYNAMNSAIKAASEEILLESYIFELDDVGQKFIDSLNNMAMSGIEIKIHLDAVGSSFFLQGNNLKKMLHRNIELKWFHRWSWRRPWQFNIRNHRKLLIIDGVTVFIGGFNIHNQCSLEHYGKNRWLDSHVKIKSSVATNFKTYFNNLWYKRQQHYLGELNNIDLIPNLSPRCRYLLRCRLKLLVDNAEKKILCTTPYFVPDEFIIKALIKAAKRGVEVKLLVPFESDHAIVNSLANYYYLRLLQAKIAIFAYYPRMLHAKTLVVDNRTVMIGSANIDYRSMFINHELVCLFNSPHLAKRMSKEFNYNCQQAIRITAKTKFNVKAWWFWRPLAALLKHWI